MFWGSKYAENAFAAEALLRPLAGNATAVKRVDREKRVDSQGPEKRSRP